MTSDKQKARGYKDLLVWQKAMLVVKRIYEVTKQFPADERFGLTSQMRRAGVSIPSNIAEGQARHSTGEFIQFISHAEGSVAELETQLTIANDLGYCTIDQAQPILDFVGGVAQDAQQLEKKATNVMTRARLVLLVTCHSTLVT